MPATGSGTGTGGTGTGRRSGAARRAARAGAAARATPATAVGVPPAGRGTTPAAGATPTQPRRKYLGIGLAVLAALAVLGFIAFMMRPTINVNVNNGGSKVTVNLPDTRTSSPVTTPSPSHSTKPTASPSASASASPSPTSSGMESEYSHWISPANVTTACHEQASPATTAVFQNQLYNASPVADNWYCQVIQGYTQPYWYSPQTAQPLGPIIPTSPDLSDSVNLSAYCQFTYGQKGDGQWKAENGPNDEYHWDPPAPGHNPFPHEMCVKV